MFYRSHAFLEGVEMGVVGLDGHSLALLSHVAMIGEMVALMVYRRYRYAHGTHGPRA